ncbi:MAG: glycosyltransferase family 4 protein [Proteobacteria bacterium]|nr:glycosyltransferase family 4 protein [Pseudomonadota bacterium]
MHPPRRILFFSTHTYPSKAGGGLSAFRFACFLAGRGHEVVHLSFNWNLRESHQDVVDGIKIIRLPFFDFIKAAKALSRPLLVPGIVRYTRQADLAIIYGCAPGYDVALLTGLFSRTQIVFRSTMLGSDDIETMINRAWFPRYRRWAMSKVDRYFATNPEFSAAWSRVFANRVPVVETTPGTDVTRFRPVSGEVRQQLRQKLGIANDVPVVLSVGWVVLRKGFDGVFRVLSQVKRPFQYLVVGTCIGDPDHEIGHQWADEITSLVKMGRDMLGERVQFLGPKDNVEEYMQLADVFVLNSHEEGTPNVVIEAMASGLPCLVRRLVGVDGYLTHHEKNALVFDNEAGLSEAMERVLADPALRRRLGNEATRFINGRFSYEAVAQRLLGPAPL